MKFLCLAYYDEKKYEAMPKAEFEAIVGQCPAYDAALRKTGQLVVSASLGSPKESTTLRPKSGKVSVTDGPFAEAKELVGGFFIIEAGDLKEAVAVASNHPAAHLGEQMGWGIEVRPIEFFEQPR
jgi:hypothetical protein